MIQKILATLVGRRFTEFFGVFIFSTGSPREAVAIYLPSPNDTWVGIAANGNGRFKTFAPLTDLYNAPEIGFSFVAPLSILFSKQEYYNYIVIEVLYQEHEHYAMGSILFSNGTSLDIKVEDDSLIIRLLES